MLRATYAVLSLALLVGLSASATSYRAGVFANGRAIASRVFDGPGPTPPPIPLARPKVLLADGPGPTPPPVPLPA